MTLRQAIERLAGYHPKIRVTPIQRGENRGMYRVRNLRGRGAKGPTHWVMGDRIMTAGGCLAYLAWVTHNGLTPKWPAVHVGYEATRAPQEIREAVAWRGRLPKRGVSIHHERALEWMCSKGGA